MITKTKIKRTKASDARRQLKQAILFCFIYLLAPGSIFSQENPWESKPKGENPWVNQQTKEAEEETVKSVNADTVSRVVIINGEVIPSESTASTTSTELDVASKSTATIRHFKVNGQEVVLNTKDYGYSRKLKNQGSQMHIADGALGAGIATGIFVSVFALPVNLIASVIPTNKMNREVEQFKKDNPHATSEEVKMIKSGITNKRVRKAILGNVIGVGINLTAILVMFFL